jgi:hypothetical protein
MLGSRRKGEMEVRGRQYSDGVVLGCSLTEVGMGF